MVERFRKKKNIQKEIIQAMKLMATLQVVQDDMNLLQDLGYQFAHKLKQKANIFKEELAKEIDRMCDVNGGIDEKAFTYYAKLADAVQNGINVSFANEFSKDYDENGQLIPIEPKDYFYYNVLLNSTKTKEIMVYKSGGYWLGGEPRMYKADEVENLGTVIG